MEAHRVAQHVNILFIVCNLCNLILRIEEHSFDLLIDTIRSVAGWLA